MTATEEFASPPEETNSGNPEMAKPDGQKELIVKRISASEFEVCEGGAEGRGTCAARRQTVIRRAPPSARSAEERGAPPPKRGRSEPTGVILIKDAIAYRIVEILMWKVAGEGRLRRLGYPAASTSQLLWRLVSHDSPPEGVSVGRLPQDHDCGRNVACFSRHVSRFLETSAPELWRRTGRGRLSVEELLRRIYHEDLIPYLRNLDLRNGVKVLQCHSDIVLLEKWEKQRFTAVTWSG